MVKKQRESALGDLKSNLCNLDVKQDLNPWTVLELLKQNLERRANKVIFSHCIPCSLTWGRPLLPSLTPCSQPVKWRVNN